jgi:hypothetical protein
MFKANQLAIRVSNRTKHDVNFEYSGHNKLIWIYYYENGFVKCDELGTRHTQLVWIDLENLPNQVIKEKLKYAIKLLERLL